MRETQQADSAIPAPTHQSPIILTADEEHRAEKDQAKDQTKPPEILSRHKPASAINWPPPSLLRLPVALRFGLGE
jgi:hypothetical protein